jgi:hypothetical protein
MVLSHAAEDGRKLAAWANPRRGGGGGARVEFGGGAARAADGEHGGPAEGVRGVCARAGGRR